MGGALGRKKGGGREKKMRPWGLNSPHSKGCWVFIYSGRGQSTFDCSTVTSRNPLQLLGIRVFKAVWMKGRRVVTG